MFVKGGVFGGAAGLVFGSLNWIIARSSLPEGRILSGVIVCFIWVVGVFFLLAFVFVFASAFSN